MNWENLIVQLGISGLVLFVVYQLGLKLIKVWRESEKERNANLSQNEKERNAAISAGFQADTAAHQQLVQVMQQIMRWCARIESKIDTAFDLTPRPQEIPTIPPMQPIPSVVIDPTLHDNDITPVEGPKLPVKRAQSEPGVPKSTGYGPFGERGKPHKTSG
jgi:hypothetical protein